MKKNKCITCKGTGHKRKHIYGGILYRYVPCENCKGTGRKKEGVDLLK